jgi:hypothetical protein
MIRIKIILISLIHVLLVSNIIAQETKENVDAPLGLRFNRDGVDYLIFSVDQNMGVELNDFRKINYKVYFRKVNIAPIPDPRDPTKKLQLITIPGSSSSLSQNKSHTAGLMSAFPRSGKTVDKEDYDLNFWIDVESMEKNTSTEYYKYANDIFSGLLTAPFKYRLKRGDAPEALIDGDFNVAPFLGWKFRVSSVRPYYIAPFIFTGITTLNYNSANNSEITDADQLENGTGITYGLGIGFKFGEITPGIVLGYDKSLGNLGNGFLYSNKPWLSFSISFDFFSNKQTSSSQ